MTASELKAAIIKTFANVRHVRSADLNYAIGISEKKLKQEYKRWRYGWLGFGAPKPLYYPEGQDCDDEVRAFVVWYRRRNRINDRALPIFHLGDWTHAYVGYRDEYGAIRAFDLNDGQHKNADINFVEMV